MALDESQALAPLVAKLERSVRLDERDRLLIQSLQHSVREFEPGHNLVKEGAPATECSVLLSGYACRCKYSANGGRQILSFHLPGDLLDAQHLLLAVADHNIQTITEASLALIPKAELRRVAKESYRIGAALWRDTLIDASIFREWVLNVGRRDAKSRIAHLLCEFAARCEHAGLGSARQFRLPMTQEQIADATGLTGVHVNRMLRALEQEGLIARERRDIRIVDWERMRAMADFDPTYLHAA